jgi:hypothetical protein
MNYLESYTKFENDMLVISELAKIEIKKEQQKKYLEKMLFVNVITLMEIYLKDTFEYAKKSESNKTKQLIDFCIKDNFIFNNSNKFKIYEHMLNIILDKKIIGRIIKAIKKRHDIVHRNGKDNKNNEIEFILTDFNRKIGLIEDMKKFIENIHEQLTKL